MSIFFKVRYSKSLQRQVYSGVTEGVRAITPPSRKSLPFLKEHKDENILFVLSHLNFCPTIEKCYYLPILLKISTEAVKITHNESFKDNGCSIAI